MLPKKYRFSKPDKPVWLKAKKNKINADYFDILYFYSNSIKNPKIIISAGVKVANLATKRHKIKRVINEALYGLLPKINKNIFILIIVKKSCLDKTLKEISAEIEKVFKQRGIIK